VSHTTYDVGAGRPSERPRMVVKEWRASSWPTDVSAEYFVVGQLQVLRRLALRASELTLNIDRQSCKLDVTSRDCKTGAMPTDLCKSFDLLSLSLSREFAFSRVRQDACLRSFSLSSRMTIEAIGCDTRRTFRDNWRQPRENSDSARWAHPLYERAWILR